MMNVHMKEINIWTVGFMIAPRVGSEKNRWWDNWSVAAERSSASDSRSGVVRNMGLNPGLAGRGVLEQDT